jgi:hypothetical protein
MIKKLKANVTEQKQYGVGQLVQKQHRFKRRAALPLQQCAPACSWPYAASRFTQTGTNMPVCLHSALLLHAQH